MVVLVLRLVLGVVVAVVVGLCVVCWLLFVAVLVCVVG